MAEKADSTIATEVHSRLDDFFGQSEENRAFVEGSSGLEGSPLKDLKAIVLSIDWEITDEIMTRFIDQMGILEDRYREDRILMLFMRLLSSVGKYIKTSKASAHPDAMKLFNSIYNSLEKVFLTEGMTETEKKQALRILVAKFKKLKEQIVLRKAGTAKGKEVSPPDMVPVPPHEPVTYALEEVKQFIKAEFRALRAELKSWKEG